MTAEIAVMNRQAVALAADSAVTFRTGNGQKIFTSADKIFCLSKNHSVGIMVYGNASLMQVPWETIVKVYSEKLADKKFNSLEKYSNDFLKFIENNRTLFPQKEQTNYIQGNINGYFRFLQKKIIDRTRNELEKKKKLKEADIQQMVSGVINEEHDAWKKCDFLPKATEKKLGEFKKKHKSHIQKIRKAIFEKLPLTSTNSKKIDEIGAWIFFKFRDDGVSPGVSGLVVAGFGEKDVYPSLNSYTIEGIADGFLKVKKDGDSKVGVDTDAAILPFAQREMVVRFIEGIDPAFLNLIAGGLGELANRYPKMVLDKLSISDKEKKRLSAEIAKETQSSTKEFLERFKKIRREHFVDPILQVVGILPKDELSIMAETLITLTSFKRRVSMEDETVGGPVDVGVISKGDGFVWTKRKEYFNRHIQE